MGRIFFMYIAITTTVPPLAIHCLGPNSNCLSADFKHFVGNTVSNDREMDLLDIYSESTVNPSVYSLLDSKSAVTDSMSRSNQDATKFFITDYVLLLCS